MFSFKTPNRANIVPPPGDEEQADKIMLQIILELTDGLRVHTDHWLTESDSVNNLVERRLADLASSERLIVCYAGMILLWVDPANRPSCPSDYLPTAGDKLTSKKTWTTFTVTSDRIDSVHDAITVGGDGWTYYILRSTLSDYWLIPAGRFV